MNTDLSPVVLLRRIARLEATVGRLNDDLGNILSSVGYQALQWQQRPKKLGVRAAAAPTQTITAKTAKNQAAQAADGLAGATARGEAARVQWVRDGVVVPGEQLAQSWGLTRQALAPAVARGEIFTVKVGNRLYYPQAFLGLDRVAVANICRALGDLSASEKLMFWLREHGALAGKSIASALDAGTGLAKVERLAAAWARERGAARVTAAA